jgi:hypothetical protein
VLISDGVAGVVDKVRDLVKSARTDS